MPSTGVSTLGRAASAVQVVVGVDGGGRTHRLTELAPESAVAVDVAASAADVERLLSRAGAGATLVVDDAHRASPPALAALAIAVRGGARVLLSRRPALVSAELADLEAAIVTRGGVVEEVAPLTVAAVAALLARVTGGPVDPAHAEAVHRDTHGRPAFVVALSDPAQLAARVARQLVRADLRALALVLAVGGAGDVGGAAGDDVVATAAGIRADALADLVRELREGGLCGQEADALLPVVARTVLAGATSAQRRQAHARLARANSRDATAAAHHHRAAGDRSAAAGAAYLIAGDAARPRDPAVAVDWYQLARESGVDSEDLLIGRAHANLLVGRPVEASSAPGGGDAGRRALIDGVAAAHQGRAERAVEALCAAGPPGPLLAVPSLVAVGLLDRARLASREAGPPAARLLAEAALELPDPARAVPRLIEAAEAFEAAPDLLLPDTPHALGAIAAVAIGDIATAEDLLEPACLRGVGGPHATTRHRLLLAWARLRGGRHDAAREELARIGDAVLPGRERTLCAVLIAGLARRSGEVSQLRAAWDVARPVLVRRTTDLTVAEAAEELLVAAARLREADRVHGMLHDLGAIVAGLGDPPAWHATVGWCRLQVAVATDDPGAAREAAEALASGSAGGTKHHAHRRAAQVWARSVAGQVEEASVHDAADGLAGVGLGWEASRLCGHAAIRCADPAGARRLLTRARELGEADRAGGTRTTAIGLSEREIEVARLVLAGQTHKEIGAQLFLSPKTVEHHVARIRNKVGAGTRAEMISTLRSLSL